MKELFAASAKRLVGQGGSQGDTLGPVSVVGEAMRLLKFTEGCGEEGWIRATLLKSCGQGVGVGRVWRREAGTQVSRGEGGGEQQSRHEEELSLAMLRVRSEGALEGTVVCGEAWREGALVSWLSPSPGPRDRACSSLR